jgi:hypothetical protein
VLRKKSSKDTTEKALFFIGKSAHATDRLDALMMDHKEIPVPITILGEAVGTSHL